MLKTKGFKPKLNIMDNQATKHIKKYLTKNECKFQLVEPHNHRINTAEQANQTFKDAFISALAMTDSNFPLQLWDKLTPQVRDTLNLLRTSRIDPSKSAYEILNGPYNWNRYPLPPPWMQNHRLQGRQHAQFVGIARHQGVVSGPVQRSLSM